MTKLLKLLFVFSVIAITPVAQARVCFLPGTLVGDGCLDKTTFGFEQCQGFTRTSPCPSGYTQETCVKGSQTLYKCTCNYGSNFTHENGLGEKYECTAKEYDASCGCAPKDTICNEDAYKYALADGYCKTKFPQSTPTKECQNPSDGKIFYEDCTCSTSVYPYTCTGTGLKPPSDNYCTDSKGIKHYSRCDCADNWQSNPCSERTDGCTAVSQRVEKGDNDYCYLCTNEKCATDGEVNLNNYWCSIPQGTQTDCTKLGYVYAPSGTCPNGTVGLKCMFNKQYMYCLTGKCGNGFAQKVEDCGTPSSGWSLGALDSDGCGKCSVKQCPKVNISVNANNSGSSMMEIQSTTDGNVEHCGTMGSKGYVISTTGSYSGNDACYACKPRACRAGYSTNITSIDDCQEGALFNADSFASGDKICGKCTTQSVTCQTGYTYGLKNEGNCGTTGKKGWKVEVNGDCGKCVEKDCEQGLSKKAPEVTVTKGKISFQMRTGGGGMQYLDFTANNICYTGDTECGTFTFNEEPFCDDYRREIKKCLEDNSESESDWLSCMDNADERWAQAYDNVNICQLCTGVFGSASDVFFCEHENLTPDSTWKY